MYKYVPVTEAHVAALIARIRPQDAAEVVAGGNTLAALQGHLQGFLETLTGEAFTSLVDGEGTLAAIGGIIPVGPDLGSPWFLCTVDALGEPKEFYKALKAKAMVWEDLYPNQVQRTWVANTLHARLIRKLGYTIHPRVSAEGFAIFTKGVTNYV